jgi:hypothetical protein
MGLKFAGRTESRGARFLHGTPARVRSRGASTHLQTRPTLAGVAGLLGVLCLLVAALRHVLGASARTGFWSVFAVLPVVAMRLAHRAAPEAALWLAGAVLVIGALWYLASRFLARRAPDAFLAALLAFQLFFVLRLGGAQLPSAGTLSFAALSLSQKIVLVLQLILIALLVAWSTRPVRTSGYESSAPSRVTGFLKKRRLPSRIAGAFLAAFAIIATVISARLGFGDASTPVLLRPPLLFVVWLALDGLYVIGRTLWQRVH